jgi:hypothetical protein
MAEARKTRHLKCVTQRRRALRPQVTGGAIRPAAIAPCTPYTQLGPRSQRSYVFHALRNNGLRHVPRSAGGAPGTKKEARHWHAPSKSIQPVGNNGDIWCGRDATSPYEIRICGVPWCVADTGVRNQLDLQNCLSLTIQWVVTAGPIASQTSSAARAGLLSDDLTFPEARIPSSGCARPSCREGQCRDPRRRGPNRRAKPTHHRSYRQLPKSAFHIDGTWPQAAARPERWERFLDTLLTARNRWAANQDRHGHRSRMGPPSPSLRPTKIHTIVRASFSRTVELERSCLRNSTFTQGSLTPNSAIWTVRSSTHPAKTPVTTQVRVPSLTKQRLVARPEAHKARAVHEKGGAPLAHPLQNSLNPLNTTGIFGAVEKTRTSTGCPTATSTLRVYQFRHDRTRRSAGR